MRNLKSSFSATFTRKFSFILTILLLSLAGLFQVSASNIESKLRGEGANEQYLPYLLREENLGPVSGPPVISSFAASKVTVGSGESTELFWEVAGPVDELTINNGVGEVTGLSTVTIMPNSTNTYILTATNSAGSATAELTITVNLDLPVITSFEASATTIEEGQSTTLSWSVSNFDTLTIDNSVGDVTAMNSIDVSPTEDTTYTLTASNADGSVNAGITIIVTEPVNHEIVIFDLNRKVLKGQDRGFPHDEPPDQNFDWTSPINYADGVLYARAEIFLQEDVAQQQMFLQFCFWQEKDGKRFALETCLNTEKVRGNPGNVVCWSQPIADMWQKEDTPLEWHRPRQRNGMVVKVFKVIEEISSNPGKYPVTNFDIEYKNPQGETVLMPEWAGEDPDDWYPLDLRYTVIVVAEGSEFSGWAAHGFDGCD